MSEIDTEVIEEYETSYSSNSFFSSVSKDTPSV
jgi:hypothetical protein